MLDLVAQLQAELAHERALHQPQPRRDREDVRPRRRALRRAARRGRARSRRCCRTRATRTRSGCCAASRAAACARITGASTRSPASCRASAPSSGLRVRRPLRARRRALPHGGAAAQSISSGGHESRCWYHERAASSRARRPPTSSYRRVDRDGRAARRARRLTKMFQQRGHEVHALTDVSAAIWPGETLGLVGESGSGKTTLARTLLGIVPPTDGDGHARRAGAAAALPEALAAPSCARCRSSSRTPTRRSTGATRCAGSCCAR